jgi:hypothetical protein
VFHPDVIAARERQIAATLGDQLPGGRLPRRSLQQCWDWRDRLASVAGKKGALTRSLTPDEAFVIQTERLRCMIDFPYWLERYAVVAKETQDAEPLTPLWASQTLFLNRIAAIEHAHYFGGHPDGILVNVLKARQLGLSTLTETILAHRATTQATLRGLVAADVEEQAVYLMSMAEMVIAHLPWWLRPEVTAHQTGRFWEAATGSTLRVAYGKSARGGLQDNAKQKGNLGRGKTYGCLHLSELSTWERPEQIDDALMPGVPRRPRTFAVFESTAKGRYDWWHTQWLATAKGKTRFTNIFIPWYIEPDKYWLPPPPGWEPDARTKAHADSVQTDSPSYLMGATIRLSAAQLYWYEQTRGAYEEKGDLYKFYEEYPANDREAFQYAGRSIFPPNVLERIKQFEQPPRAVVFVEPAKDIAQLRQWEAAQANQVAAAAATP